MARAFSGLLALLVVMLLPPELAGQDERPAVRRRVESNLERASAALRQNRPDDAREHIEKALQWNARSVPALLMQARVLLVSREFDEGLDVLDDLLEIDPFHAEAHWLAAAAHSMLDRDDRALPHLTEIVAIGGISPIVYKALAQRAAILLGENNLTGGLADIEDSEFVAYEFFNRVLQIPNLGQAAPGSEMEEQRRILFTARSQAIDHYVNLRQHRARILARLGRNDEIAEVLAGILELTVRENSGLLLDYAFGHYDAVIDAAAKRDPGSPIAGEFNLRILAFSSMAIGDEDAYERLAGMSDRADRFRTLRRPSSRDQAVEDMETRFDEAQRLLIDKETTQATDILREIAAMRMGTHPAYRMALVQLFALETEAHAAGIDEIMP